MAPTSKTITALGFAGIFLIGLAARLHDIAAKPFWMDEITTLRRASLPLPRMVSDSLFFHQLPAFFVVTSWAIPFGTTEPFVRAPAILFGALACALGFGIARSLAGLPAGLAAGLLIAFAPSQVQYGQEARSYTMMICAILLALWGLAQLAREERSTAWAAYIIGSIAALNILGDALFWFVAANVAAPALANTARPRFWRRWLAAQCIILLFAVPWFAAIKLVGQRGALGGLDWVPPLTAARLWWSIAGTYFMFPTSLIKVQIFRPGIPGLGLLVAGMALAGAASLRRRPAVLAVLAAAILVLPIGLFTVSLFKPVLMPRYLLWSAAPFFILASLALTSLPRRLQLPAAAALGLLLWLNLRPYYHDETKPRWDLAGAELQAELHPGDFLLVNDPQAVSTMNLYLARTGHVLPRTMWSTSLSQALAEQRAGHRIFAVQGPVGQADHESQAHFIGRIAALGAQAAAERAGQDIIILEFAPKA